MTKLSVRSVARTPTDITWLETSAWVSPAEHRAFRSRAERSFDICNESACVLPGLMQERRVFAVYPLPCLIKRMRVYAALVPARVPVLGSLIRPADIPFSVRPVIIPAVQSHAWRPWPEQGFDVGHEQTDVVPSLADSDSAATPVRVLGEGRVVAALHHGPPRVIQRVVAESVLAGAAAREPWAPGAYEIGQPGFVDGSAIADQAYASKATRAVWALCRNPDFSQYGTAAEPVAWRDDMGTLTHGRSPASIRLRAQEPSGAPTPDGSVSSSSVPKPNKRRACTSCGNPVWIGTSSRPDPVCRPCRKIRRSRFCRQCSALYDPLDRGRYTYYCSVNCRDTAARERERVRQRAERRARKAKRRLTYDGVSDAAIFERDDWLCQVPGCGEPISRDVVHPDPLSASVDHIVPLSLGGDDTASNKRAAHLICNMRRGTRDAAPEPASGWRQQTIAEHPAQKPLADPRHEPVPAAALWWTGVRPLITPPQIRQRERCVAISQQDPYCSACLYLRTSRGHKTQCLTTGLDSLSL